MEDLCVKRIKNNNNNKNIKEILVLVIWGMAPLCVSWRILA